MADRQRSHLARLALVLIGLSLASCSSPADKARKKYEFLKANGGTLGEVCSAGREMLAALSEAGDKRYGQDRVGVSVDCTTAEQLGSNMPANQQDAAYTIEADNMDALPDATPATSSDLVTPAAAERTDAGDEPRLDENGLDANGFAD